jgi:hypothetical protein
LGLAYLEIPILLPGFLCLLVRVPSRWRNPFAVKFDQ